MPPVENLSSSSINYLYCIAGISFGLGWLTGAYEIFRRISPNEEYQRIFNSIVLIAGINTTSSLMPLIFSETTYYLVVSSYWLFFTGAPTYILLLYQLRTGQVRLYDHRASPILFVGSAIVLIMIIVNAHFFDSIVLYKCFILWATCILSYRFFLFIRVVGMMKTDQLLSPPGQIATVKAEVMN